MTLPLAPWLATLVLASLKGSIILIVALVALRGMRRSSAEARHAILAIALVAFLVVPLATLLAPAWTFIRVPAVPARVTAAIQFDRLTDERGGESGLHRDANDLPVGAGFDVAGDEQSADAGGSRPANFLTDGELASRAAPRSTIDLARPLAIGEWLTLAWLVGASLIVLRLLLAVVRLRMLSRRATMVTDGNWLATAHAIARRLGLTRGVTLLRGDREAVPMTWGVLSPVVWLPPAADAWPAELRTSVLSHELAHVRRRDAITQWLANAALAMHWFNPLVWVATRALRAERERACDDAVLALGAAPDDYAAHLLDMVRALGARSGPAPAMAMAMARRSQFEGRLLAILDRACSRAPVGAARLIGAGAGAMALVLVLGGLRSSEAARMPEQGKDSTRHADTPITTPESRSPRPAAGIPATPPPSISAKSRRNAPVRDVPRPPAVVAHVTVEARATVDAPSAVEMLRQTPAPDPSGQQAASLARTDTALLLDVIAAAEGISSAGDRTAVLERVASLPNLAPAVVTALGRAASRVPSGTSRAKLLRTIVRKQSHAAGVSRRAVLDALNGEIASTDFASVLEVFVQREGLDEAALADAFTAAARISSNSEKARVLVGAARLRKPEGTARAAYLKAAGSIASGSERARALSALFEDPTQQIEPPGS